MPTISNGNQNLFVPIIHSTSQEPQIQSERNVDAAQPAMSSEQNARQMLRDRARLGLASTAIRQTTDDKIRNGLSSYESLTLWTEKTLVQIKKEYGENFLDQFERNSDGSLKTPDAIRKLLKPVAYDIYADQEIEGQKFSSVEQEEFLKEMATLSDGTACRIHAQAADDNKDVVECSPLDALKRNKEQAKLSHFYISPHDLEQRRAPRDDADFARLNLSVSPENVLAVARHLVSLFPTFANVLENIKITAAREQGTRTDSIVVYLNRADHEQARELAAQLKNLTNPAVWQTHTLFGMHLLEPGIGYAEISQNAESGSYGVDRSAIVAEALLIHLEFGVPIKEALDEVLLERGYSLENPAFLSQS